nr:ribonuclease H-like domain, reverse transcriptase, RNA-dependent DNA polymerase [Tanacetum cinerariifolium]
MLQLSIPLSMIPISDSFGPLLGLKQRMKEPRFSPVDGKLRTISESSIRKNLKLKDEAGISSLPDAKLFENLTLMGYSILPNQKFSFQKGQFSHQWKYLIHTIMQCLSPKRTRFNEFSSNIATALVCLATNRVFNFSKMIFDGEGSGTPTEPHHTPSPEAQQTSPTATSSPSLPPVITPSIPTVIPSDVPQLRQYSRRARIAQSSAFPPVADEPASPIRDDNFPIKGRRLDEGEEVPVERSTERGTDDTEEMLRARVKLLEDRDGGVPTGSGSIPTASPPSIGVPTGSGMVPTASPIFTTATESTPYTRGKRKEKMMVREDQRRNEHIERDAKIARIHAEEELHMMIDGLDRNNETVAKYLQEYHQFAAELPIERRIELISDLVKYQDHYAKVLKFQTQQRKPLSRKQQKEFYMSVLKSHSEEGERFKRKGLRLEQDSPKKVKISKEVPEENLKEMMQLIPVEVVYVEALQVKHPIIDWEHFDKEDLNQLWALVKETLNIRQATSNKEKELWVELKRLYEPDVEDLIDEFPLPEEVPTASEETSDGKKGRTVAVTIEDMQKKRNDVKARTTLLLALPDEHQLRFIKYKTAQELWAAILKTFGGNVATRKTKKNLLKQQYGNFKSKGKETLEQTFNILQAINIALLSMRADRFWKKTWKKISIQGTDVASFDKSKVECLNCHKMGHFARECRATRSQEKGRRDNYKQGSKEEEQVPKDLMAIDEVEFTQMAKSGTDNELFDNSLCSKAYSLIVVKTDKKETVRKPTVKYDELYRKTSKRTQSRVPRVPTVNRKFPTVNRKFPT